MNNAKFNSKEPSPHRYFWGELWRRTSNPLTDMTFLIYFTLAVIVLAFLGAWSELIKNLISPGKTNFEGIKSSLSIIYPALVGGSCLLLALEATDKSEKLKTAFAIFVLFITFAAATVIGIFEYKKMYPKFSSTVTIMFSVFGLWIWCYANGDNPYLRTKDRYSASGGDTSRNIKGNLKGFKK